MSDLISRQAAIEVADAVWCVTGDKNVAKVWDQIKDLPTVQQWIPCNWHTKGENLPKECKSVLVCIKEKSGYQIGVSYRADYNRWEGFGRTNVIAWMPLPEPWRGEEDETD